MLRAVVAPLDAAFSESCYTTASYNDYGYGARHVLTFLADLLSCYPRGIRLGWCGVRRDMFELATQAWCHLGFCCPITIDATSAPRLITGPPDPAEVRISCRSAWLDSADLYAFEFGRASESEFAANPKSRPPELSPEDADALSIVRSGFLATVMHELTRLAADPNAGLRRFGSTGAASPAFWCAGAPYRPVELKILAAGTRLQELEPRAYHAVVFPHGAMFAAGFDGALEAMGTAERLLRRDGVLVFKAEIAAGASPHPKFFDPGLLGKDGLTARLAAFTELVADGGFDPRLSRATVDRTWPQDGPRLGEAYFLTLEDGRILIPSLWFLRRRETAGQMQWGNLRSWLFERRLGEQIEYLHVGAAGRRDAEGRIETVPGREGHVFFGPYLAMPSGRYRVTVSMQTSPGVRYRDASGAVLEVAAGRTILASQAFDRNSIKSGELTMKFAVSSGEAAQGEALKIRVYSPSNFAATFTSVDLRALKTDSTQTPTGPR